ncbi:hypothetical protein HQ545_05395 [Candidatus Woesearchaeota archaeon]|nr:hypothetical protein [Candidatus Woesearchaeota archaeon]
MSKKAQSAMEFLMTYGWAILVVLAAVAALAYFGVLSPTKFLPESCVIGSTSGFSCLDFKVTSDAAFLLIMNSGGRNFVVHNITIDSCTSSFDRSMPNGDKQVFNITGCDFGNKGDSVKKDLIIDYSDQMSGFQKSVTGTITAKIM